MAAPYKHFADREALLVELARTGDEEQHERFCAAMAGTDDPVEQLAAFAAAYVQFSADSRGPPRTALEPTKRRGPRRGPHAGGRWPRPAGPPERTR